MPGKHRKPSSIQTEVAKRGGTGLAAAALSVTGLSTAVVTGTTAAVAPNVQLMALVSAANSTSQFFAGSSYYGTDWTDVYGEQQVVPFLLGPQGIANAIASHRNDPEPTGVTASGWGAGQTGTALASMFDEDLENVDLVILDNNTNRAAGGFWTTYAPFAPLLFTSADPTPTDLDVPILDVGYDYNINGNAPTDPANPFALGNSLAAYAYGYGAEQRAVIPQAVIDEAKNVDGDHFHYVLDENGEILEKHPVEGNTTFVTIKSEHLPLLRPLRLIPGGDIVADTLEPTVTELVDAGYENGDPIPDDPGKETRPMRLFSSFENLDDVPESAQTGLQNGRTTAVDDVSYPENFITKPIGEIGSLPFLSTLTNSSVSQNNLASAKSAAPTTSATASYNNNRPRPLKNAADDFNSSLKKFADSLKKAPAASENETDEGE